MVVVIVVVLCADEGVIVTAFSVRVCDVMAPRVCIVIS